MKLRVAAALAAWLVAAGTLAAGRAPLPLVVAADVPMYPRAAIDARTSATVQLTASTDGQKVTAVRTLSGAVGNASSLTSAALENIKTWRFAPHQATSFDVTYRFAMLTRGCESLGRDTHAAATIHFPTTVDVFAEVDGTCPGSTPPPPVFGIYITRAAVPFYPPAARERGIDGDVTISVSQKGVLTIADGPDELAKPMMQTVSDWQFSPPPFPEPVRFTFKLTEGDCAAGGPTVSVGPGLSWFEVASPRACGR